MRELELDHHGRGAQHRVDVAVALADDRHLGVAAGGELRRVVRGGRAAAATPRSRSRRDRPRPPPHRGPRRTPPPPDRRRSAPCRSPAPAAGRARAPGCGPRGSRSAERRRCRPRSIPRPRPATRARPPCRSPRCGRARGSSATMRIWSWCGNEMSPAKRPRPLDQRRVFQPLDRLADPFVVASDRRELARLAHAAACSSARRVTVRVRSRR